MALLEQGISLKVLYPGLEQKIYTVQSDTGRTVKCTIEDWTIPDGATATVYVMKPSKAIVYNSCTVDKDTNSVIVELTNQILAEQGLSAAMVEITSDGEIVTAFQFGIVNRGKITGGTESSNESTVLQTMLDELAASVNEAVVNANTAANNVNAAIENANKAAELANAAANNIEYIKEASAESAAQAAASENTAKENASSASESATLSESWAIGGTGTRDGEDTDNAKYYAEQAAESAESADTTKEEISTLLTDMEEATTKAVEATAGATDAATAANEATETANTATAKATAAAETADTSTSNANAAAETADTAKASLDESTASAEEAAETLKEAAEEVASETTAENIVALIEASLTYLGIIADNAGKADTVNGFTFEKNSSDQMVVIYADEDTEETDTVVLPTETTLSAISDAMDDTVALLKDMSNN